MGVEKERSRESDRLYWRIGLGEKGTVGCDCGRVKTLKDAGVIDARKLGMSFRVADRA